MPQVNIDTIVAVCGGGDDRKITCETLPDGDGKAPEDQDIPDSALVYPPESFWLSKDAEFDWFDRNAFLERKESTKGNSNSKNLSSSSQKFTVNLKSKATIIGLPKTQKNTHIDSKRRHCKPENIRLFPKRSSSAGRRPAAVPVAEPSSPKVSCIGRVRSKRCPNRRKSSAPATQPQKPVSQEKTGKEQKNGIMSRITSLFRSGDHRRRKSNKSPVKVNEQSENSAPRRNRSVKRVNSEPAAPPDPPGLGGMNRFTSGRRSESWIETDGIDGAGRRPTG